MADDRFVGPDEGSDNVIYGRLGESDLWVGEPASGPTLEKSFDFALEIIRLYKVMQDGREYVISKQLLRSGTSIGANVEEAGAASSRRDFLHKMTIASKEARETVYWLRLIDASDIVTDLDVKPQLESADELVRLLKAIVKTTRGTTK